MNLKIIKKLYTNEYELIIDGKCPFCFVKINPSSDFKDQISITEYYISGLCQKCQDKVFDGKLK